MTLFRLPHLATAVAAAAAAAMCLPMLVNAQQAAAAAPKLTTTVVADNLRGPWDIAFTPDAGAMFFTEKCHGLSVRLADGTVRRLFGNTGDYGLRADDLFCQGQSGVHGVAVDRQWAEGKRFVYVFSASNLAKSPRTNRVIRLAIDAGLRTASDRTDIVTDIAFKEAARLGGPGAHSGGRLRFGPDGYLWVTTGDNHEPDLPQDPKKLGGKVLRIDRDGKPAPGNTTAAGFDPRIYTYGHRNPQGIAFRPAGGADAGRAYTAEHGPNHTDEVTALVSGGNAGWDPRNRPGLRCNDGYCGYAGDAQTMPMTDTARFPSAMPPAWANNGRSQGMGPAVFLSGAGWGAWQGALAVGLMGARALEVMTLDAAGKVTATVRADVPAARYRSLVQAPDGALWASTDDGTVLRIAPRAP
jgi:aldose sugar dehydrogenase